MSDCIKVNVLDLNKLMKAGIEAQKKIEQWPTWKQELVKAVHDRMSTEKLH